MHSALQQSHKSDEEVATALKQITLTEELTRGAMDSMSEYLPGPLATEQIYVLEGRSALLTPPAGDLPATAAPDPAAQKAILAKAVDYVTKTFAEGPHVVATRTTARFQDGLENTQINDSGTSHQMTDMNVQELGKRSPHMRLLGTYDSVVEYDKGIEKVPRVKNKMQWGQNGQISEGGPVPISASSCLKLLRPAS